MTKKLNENVIKNELEGSVFFRNSTKNDMGNTDQEDTPKIKPIPKDTTRPDKHGVMTSCDHAVMPSSNHAINLPRYHEDLVENIRKSLKSYGKESTTIRFTMSEKNEITELIFSYHRKGIKTTANEITRIAINFIIADYKECGDDSILGLVLMRLND